MEFEAYCSPFGDMEDLLDLVSDYNLYEFMYTINCNNHNNK